MRYFRAYRYLWSGRLTFKKWGLKWIIRYCDRFKTLLFGQAPWLRRFILFHELLAAIYSSYPVFLRFFCLLLCSWFAFAFLVFILIFIVLLGTEHCAPGLLLHNLHQMHRRDCEKADLYSPCLPAVGVLNLVDRSATLPLIRFVVEFQEFFTLGSVDWVPWSWLLVQL